MGEKTSEDGFQGGDGEGDHCSCDLGVFNAQHWVVGPAAVGVPLALDDEPDADGGDDDDAFRD